MNLIYTKYELIRTFRNRRFFLFSLGFPLVLYYVFAGGNRHAVLGGIPFPTYYLASMATFGTMSAMIASGGRIAGERSVGWNRQLRLTPLTPRAYFRTKILTAYMMAFTTVIVLFVAAATLGVHLSVAGVLRMLGLVVVGLIPFAGLGIWIGHQFTPDSIGPVLGGGVSLLALLGGVWTPLGGNHGLLHDVSQATPTYWLVQAGHTLVGEKAWSGTGWLVVAIWSIVLGGLAVRAYRRDTQRV